MVGITQTLSSFCSTLTLMFLIYIDIIQCACPNCLTGCIITSCTGTCAPRHYFLATRIALTDWWSCEPCIANCDTCSDGTSCTTCIPGYFYSSSQCIQCIVPCATCQSTSTNCLSCTYPTQTVSSGQCICNPGYYTVGTSCGACIAPCANCWSSPTYCQTCVDINQTLTSTHTCVCNAGYIPNGVNCVACVAPCQNCITNTNSCTLCTDVHMILDTSTKTCTCEYGYVNNGAVCDLCVAPCDSCINTTTFCLTCTDINHLRIGTTCICQDEYYSNSVSTCAHCVLPCKNCTINGCLTCVDAIQVIVNLACVCRTGYYMSNYQCLQCQAPCESCVETANHCLTCNDIHQFINDNICYCQPGYYMHENFCQQCTLPCVECIDNNYTCTQCVDQFHLVINQRCQCSTGFVNNGNKCDACVPPCKSCLGTVNNCTSCVDDNVYNLIDNKCQCKHGFVNQDNYCVQCGVQCLTCQHSPDNCTSCTSLNHKLNLNNECICDIGYVQQANQCVKCQQQCFSCLIQSDICTSCNIGYYLDNYQCHQCDLTCSICQAQTICSQCIQGYYLNNQLCHKCSANCKQCIIDTECQQCDINYYNDGNICLLCEFPCRTCKQLTTKCLTCVDSIHQLYQNQCKCKDKYYQLDTGHCIECPIHCLTCTLNTCLTCQDTCSECDWNGCKQCKESNYFINSQVCSICPFPCLTCDILTCFTCQLPCLKCNHQECLNCQDGYKVVNGRCVDCSSEFGMMQKECNYSNCSDGKWTQGEECDDGNYIQRDGCSNCLVDKGYTCMNNPLRASECYQCNVNCQRCGLDQFDKIQCIICNTGYFLTNNQCIECPTNCISCTSLTNCQSCVILNTIPNNGICKYCDQDAGMYLSPDLNCKSKCGDGIVSVDEDCDDGNIVDNDGCSQDCRFSIQQLSDDQMNLQYVNSTTTNNLVLSSTMNLNCSLIQINIEGFEQEQFKYLVKTNNNDCIIEFEFYKSIMQFNRIHILVQQLRNRLLEQQQIQEIIITPRITYYSTPEQDYQAQQLQRVQEQLGLSIYIIGPAAILLGGLDTFVAILDILAWLNNLYYINVYYPKNVAIIFQNSAWGDINFIPSPIQLNQPDDDYYLESPPRFLEKGVDSMLINNLWLSICLQVGTLITYVLCHYMLKLTEYQDKHKQTQKIPQIFGLDLSTNKHIVIQKQSKEIKIKSSQISIKLRQYCLKIKSNIISTANLSLLDYSMASCLQITTINKNPESKDNTLIIINYIASYILLILVGIIMYLAYLVSTKSSKQLVNTVYSNQFGSFYENINVHSRTAMMYSLCNLLRKFLFIVALITLYDLPLLQCYVCTIVTFSNVALILIENPFNSIKSLYQFGTPDFCLFFILLMCCILGTDDTIHYLEYDVRYTIGWVIIGFIGISVGTQLIFLGYEWYQSIKSKLSRICKKDVQL